MSAFRAAPGTLYLVPNLLGAVPPEAVLPRRTIDIARSLAHFVVETPKTARLFIKTLQPPRPMQSISFAQIDAHTSRVDELLAPVLAGQDLGLVSDAGCPGVADPGATLVRAAHDAGIRVIPLVGPSAILLALMASGMNGQQFAFHGYLPVKPAARNETIKSLDDASAHTGTTQIFIETPYRNEALVAAALEACRASTRFCVALDLTLPSEQVICRSIAQWRKLPLPALAKRPAMFLLGRA